MGGRGTYMGVGGGAYPMGSPNWTGPTAAYNPQGAPNWANYAMMAGGPPPPTGPQYGNYGGPAPGVYASGGGTSTVAPSYRNSTAAFLMSPQGQQLMAALRARSISGAGAAPMGAPPVNPNAIGAAPIMNTGYNTPVYRGA